jgi:hypothetical protein
MDGIERMNTIKDCILKLVNTDCYVSIKTNPKEFLIKIEIKIPEPEYIISNSGK